MKFYKIIHVPTGLFYKPCSEVRVPGDGSYTGWTKTNLSKNGKVYSRRPSLASLGDKYYNHLLATGSLRNVLAHVVAADWEILEYEAKP